MFVSGNQETGCFSLAEREITVLVVFALKPPRGAFSCTRRAFGESPNADRRFG
jgi:hypothetical protein